MPEPLKLIGVPGSPYSRKMRAVLRYRRIAFDWVLQNSPEADALPTPKVPVIPVIGFVDDDGVCREVMTDSSPQIMRLEAMFGGRSIVPTDPVVAFIDVLLEDFADEWVTKMMYHYRWYYDAAIDKAGRMLPLQADLTIADDQWQAAQSWITERQISRRALVGSTEENRPIIEDSYVRLLRLLDAHLAVNDHLFGMSTGSGRVRTPRPAQPADVVGPRSRRHRRARRAAAPWCGSNAWRTAPDSPSTAITAGATETPFPTPRWHCWARLGGPMHRWPSWWPTTRPSTPATR